MKAIYTETQDLREAAQELSDEAFNAYVEQMGWKSPTEQQAVRDRFVERCTAGMTLMFMLDGDGASPHPLSVTASKIMDAGREALGIDKEVFYAQLKEDVALNMVSFKQAGKEGGSDE